MEKEKQKELLKSALKNAMPAIHTELSKALDFADKFVDAGNSFNELNHETQNIVFKTLLTIITNPHPFINPNYHNK